MPTHTPAERQKNLSLAPPPEFVNPLMLPERPQQQGAINPLLEEVISARSAAPGAGGGFAGSPTQQGIAAGGASFSADLDVASRGGLTPSFIQSLGKALQAGSRGFAEAKQAEATERQQLKTQELLNAAQTPEERIAALRQVQNGFIAMGNDDAANGLESIIQNLIPDEEFVTTSLGGGLGVITNKKTGSFREIGERDPLRGEGKGAGTNKPHPIQAVNPESDKVEIGYWTDANPLKIVFSGIEPAIVGEDDVTSAQGTALFQGSNVVGGLRDLQEFYGIDITQPLEGQDLQNNPGFFAQWLISNDPTGWGRGLVGDEQKLFSQGQSKALEAIARLATGAAINAGEEKRFKTMLPQLGDGRATVLNKLLFLQDLQAVLQVMAGSGITDQEQARAMLQKAGIIQRADPNIDQTQARADALRDNIDVELGF